MGNLGPSLNRAKQATSTTGTGTISLNGGAFTAFRTWANSKAVSGVSYPYLIEDGVNWELGVGTYTSGSPPTLTRSVRESTNSDTLISLSGSAYVSCVEGRQDMAEAYYNGSSTNVVVNPAPIATTQVVSTPTIPAATVARVFAVSGMITWNTGTHGMRGNIMLDGVVVWPAGSNSQINPIASGDGAYTITFAGIPITVPGDSASHTLGLAWAAQAATTSVTIQEAWITAIKVG